MFQMLSGGFRLEVAGYRLQVSGFRLQVVGCKLLVLGYGLQVASFLFQVVEGCCRLFQVASCRLKALILLCVMTLFCNFIPHNSKSIPQSSYLKAQSSHLTPHTSYFPKHDFHTSISEVNFNNKAKTFEIILQVFTDDLESALATASKVKEFTLDKSKKQHTLIQNYLNEHFYFVDNKNLHTSIVFIGKEMEADVVKLYFEIPYKKPIKGIKLQNAIFTEMYDDQVNMTNLKYKSQKKTFIFKRGSVIQSLSLE
jgi:hypothetical protein